MHVCIPCRDVDPFMDYEGDKPVHTVCREPLSQAPYRWSPPKKRDKQAWKRIAKGEWLWDRRRVRRSYRNRGPDAETIIVSKTEIVEEEITANWLGELAQPIKVKRKRKIPGTEREVDNYRRKPREIDLGG